MEIPKEAGEIPFARTIHIKATETSDSLLYFPLMTQNEASPALKYLFPFSIGHVNLKGFL